MQEHKQPRPWDLFNKNIGRVGADIAKARLSICGLCPEYIKATHQCKKCGCIMNVKAKLPNSFCPIGKWNSVDIPLNHELTEKESESIKENLKKSDNIRL